MLRTWLRERDDLTFVDRYARLALRNYNQIARVVASSRQMGAHTCEQTRSNVPIVRREWQTAPQPAMDITKLVFWMNRLGAGHTRAASRGH